MIEDPGVPNTARMVSNKVYISGVYNPPLLASRFNNRHILCRVQIRLLDDYHIDLATSQSFYDSVWNVLVTEQREGHHEALYEEALQI